MRLLPPLLIAALCLAGSATAGRRNPLYAWTDEGGAVRYTTQLERIPEARRESARIVEPERSAVENAALLPGARIQPRVPISTEEWLEGGLPETAAEPPPVEAKLPDGDATRDLDARILRLEQAIERDQTALKELISDPEAAAEPTSAPPYALRPSAVTGFLAPADLEGDIRVATP